MNAPKIVPGPVDAIVKSSSSHLSAPCGGARSWWGWSSVVVGTRRTRW